MKRVFVPTQTGTDWQRLLAKPELHWKTGASAMTAAAAWEVAADALPGEVTRLLDSSQEPLLMRQRLLIDPIAQPFLPRKSLARMLVFN